MKTDLITDFEKCRKRLAELGQRQKDLDAKHEETLPFAEQAEISAARADIFIEYARLNVELAALARAFTVVLRASEPQAAPQHFTPLHS